MGDVHAKFPTWAEPFLKPARYKSLSGGRGSSKSWTFAQMSVLRMAGLLPDYPPEAVRIASARQFQNAIRESSKNAVEGFIRRLALEDEFDIQSYAINNLRTGSHMWFPGFNRHPESLMSIEAVDVLWIEQAETIGEEMEKIIPSMRKPGHELWFAWNPTQRSQWCWRRFNSRPRPDDLYRHINWHDNPWWFPHCEVCDTRYPWEERHRECCGKQIWSGLHELETERLEMFKYEPERYEHVYLGQPDDADADKVVLPYMLLRECVRAYEEGLMPELGGQISDMGFDIAEGGSDRCATCVRVGPVIERVDSWPGVSGDLLQAATRAHENTDGFEIARVYYDASSPIRTDLLRFDPDYGIYPVNFGGAVEGGEAYYERQSKNQDVFRSRNIQMADAVRLRARRTLRLLDNDPEIDPNACLFINPNIPDLEGYLIDLSQPTRRRNPTTGKWELDKRGGDENAESPDRFDATTMAFARDSQLGLRAR